MRLSFTRSGFPGSFRRVPTDRCGHKIGESPRTVVLRLLVCLKAAARHSADWIILWRRRRATLRKLQTLSDHYLRDIGLDRSQIGSSFEQRIDTGARTAAPAVRPMQCRF